MPVSSLDQQTVRAVLGDLLIQSDASLSRPLMDAIDALLRLEARDERPVALDDVSKLERGGRVKRTVGPATVLLYRGDIRHLQVDGIVNAANDAGLGCFEPSHKCIDNLIHRYAGPRLRADCQTVMAERGKPLVAGTGCTWTPGSYGRLACKGVMHVTGPELQPGMAPTARDERTLASCYTSVLERASKEGLQSVAFPCISTGLFGYPQAAAAKTALSTVLGFIQRDEPSSVRCVVFDVFTDADEQLYKDLLACI